MNAFAIDPIQPSSGLAITQTPQTGDAFLLPELPENAYTTLDYKTLIPTPKEPVSGQPLTGRGLGLAGAKQLAQALQSGQHTDNALFLAKNNLGDQGTLLLTKALHNDKVIKHFILSQNNITSFAAAGLADLLKVNHFIGWLVLSTNKLADAGISAIAQGIKYNKSLQHLIVDHNDISDEGMITLAEAIQTHPTLQSLVASDNKLTSQSIQALVDMLTQNKTLKKLDLRNNRFTDEDKRKLQHAVHLKQGFILYL